jgi:hypothetical protein
LICDATGRRCERGPAGDRAVTVRAPVGLFFFLKKLPVLVNAWRFTSSFMFHETGMKAHKRSAETGRTEIMFVMPTIAPFFG